MRSTFPLLAFTSISLFLIFTGCSTPEHKVTPFQFSNLFGPEYDVDGVRLLGSENRNINGCDVGISNHCSGRTAGVQVAAWDAIDESFYGLQFGVWGSGCRKYACGAETGVVFAESRRSVGLQAAGLYAKSGRHQGLQLAGVWAENGIEYEKGDASTGVQLAGVFSMSFNGMGGFQFGGLLADSDETFRGCQTSFAVAGTGGDFSGLQVSSLFSAANKEFQGVQLSILYNYVRTRAEEPPAEMHGLQLGIINQAQELHGVQIGLVNLSSDGGFRFCPIINCAFFSPRKHIEEPKAKPPSMPHP